MPANPHGSTSRRTLTPLPQRCRLSPMAHGHDKGHLHSTRTRQQHTPGFTFHSSWQGPAGSSPTQRSNGDTNPTGKNRHTSSTNSGQHRPCHGNNSIPPSPHSNTWTPVTANQCHLQNRPLLSVSLPRVRKHRTAPMSIWTAHPAIYQQPRRKPYFRRTLEPKEPPPLPLWPSDGGVQANTFYHHNVYNTSSQHEPPHPQTQTQTQKRAIPPPHPKTAPPRPAPPKLPVPQPATHHPLQIPAAEQPSPPGVPQIESRQHHSSDTPAPANNVATNPAHVVPNEYREAWLSLDDVDLHTTLQQKHVGFQSPPNFIRGRIRQAMTMSLTSIIQADTHEQKIRAWKLWMLLPRMLMHRPPNTRQLSKEEWRTRIAHFQALDPTTPCRWKEHTYPTRHQHTGAASTPSTPPSSPRWSISCPPGIDGRTPCPRWCIHPWRTSRPHQAPWSPLRAHRRCYHAICPGRTPPTPRRLDHQRPPPHTEGSSTRSFGPHRRNFALGPWWCRRHPGIPPSFTATCTSGPAPASKQCHSIGKTRSTPKTEWTHPRPRCWRPPTPSRVPKHRPTLRTNNTHSM